jgi:hypothetical protein
LSGLSRASKLSTIADASIRKNNREKKLCPAKVSKETDSIPALEGSAKPEAASRYSSR